MGNIKIGKNLSLPTNLGANGGKWKERRGRTTIKFWSSYKSYNKLISLVDPSFHLEPRRTDL